MGTYRDTLVVVPTLYCTFGGFPNKHNYRQQQLQQQPQLLKCANVSPSTWVRPEFRSATRAGSSTAWSTTSRRTAPRATPATTRTNPSTHSSKRPAPENTFPGPYSLTLSRPLLTRFEPDLTGNSSTRSRWSPVRRTRQTTMQEATTLSVRSSSTTSLSASASFRISARDSRDS